MYWCSCLLHRCNVFLRYIHETIEPSRPELRSDHHETAHPRNATFEKTLSTPPYNPKQTYEDVRTSQYVHTSQKCPQFPIIMHILECI